MLETGQVNLERGDTVVIGSYFTTHNNGPVLHRFQAEVNKLFDANLKILTTAFVNFTEHGSRESNTKNGARPARSLFLQYEV